MLELESEMNVIATRLIDTPGSINFNLGTAHKEIGREEGIEEASLYYKKANSYRYATN